MYANQRQIFHEHCHALFAHHCSDTCAHTDEGPDNERGSRRCVLIKCSSADIRYFITRLRYVYTELRNASFSPTFDTRPYTCTFWSINRENIIIKSRIGLVRSWVTLYLNFATFATTPIISFFSSSSSSSPQSR